MGALPKYLSNQLCAKVKAIGFVLRATGCKIQNSKAGGFNLVPTVNKVYLSAHRFYCGVPISESMGGGNSSYLTCHNV